MKIGTVIVGIVGIVAFLGSAPPWAWAIPLIIVALGAGWWIVTRVYRKITGHFARLDSIEQRIAELEVAVKGQPDDPLQRGTTQEVAGLKDRIDDLSDSIETFNRDE